MFAEELGGDEEGVGIRELTQGFHRMHVDGVAELRNDVADVRREEIHFLGDRL